MKNERGNQIGGTERIIPKYLGTRNTPFKTQETKKIETTRYNEIPNYLKSNNVKDDPLVEFKVNPSLLNVKKPMNQEIYPANYVPIQNKILPQDFPYVHGIHNMLPYSFVPNNVPVVKNYHISMPNPAGDHIKLADLYEDMLPQSDNKFKNTSLTLEERLITFNYVRSILVRIGDGEDIEISGKIGNTTNRKNLLSYLKLLDLNPYHDSKISKNPYEGKPDKMLMYRSCYPIRFDAAKKNVTCSKYSIGLNLRIYEMSVLEYNAKKIFSLSGTGTGTGTGIELQDVKKSKYNLWREISFYEFVREEILKKKICPHFCMIYSWFISTGSDVDFKKLRLIKEQFGNEKSKADLNTSLKIIEDYKDALKKHLNDKNYKHLQYIDNNGAIPVINKKGPAPHFQNHLKSYVTDSYGVIRQIKEMQNDPNLNFNKLLNGEFKTELNSSVNRCLLALTEAPNYNLNQWSRKTYESEMIGPVKKMIQTGYHHANEWFSVIFQLLISLQVMYIKKFTFRDMNYESNIFIKDLENNEQTIGYWKYIFDGIEFYVPNHGNLLMIDSDYKDIKNDDRALKNNTNDDEQFKMVGQAVDEEFNYDDVSGITDDGKQLDELQYENLKNLLNPGNFGNKHTNYGGIKPDTKVINLLSSIYNAVMNKKEKNGDLTDIISTYMGMFVHNRTGTPLSSTELESVNLDSPVSKLEKGKLYAYNVRDDLYAWVLFISVSVDGVNCTVLTRNNYKDTDQILKTNVNRNELFEYSSLTAIEQKYKPQEVKLSEDELLEIYYVN